MRRFERMMATPTTKMRPACMRASSEGSSMPPPVRAASPHPPLGDFTLHRFPSGFVPPPSSVDHQACRANFHWLVSRTSSRVRFTPSPPSVSSVSLSARQPWIAAVLCPAGATTANKTTTDSAQRYTQFMVMLSWKWLLHTYRTLDTESRVTRFIRWILSDLNHEPTLVRTLNSLESV